MDKPKQRVLFEQGEDLPLFSGTPQTVHLPQFRPEEAATQGRLLPAATWEELGAMQCAKSAVSAKRSHKKGARP